MNTKLKDCVQIGLALVGGGIVLAGCLLWWLAMYIALPLVIIHYLLTIL